MNPRPRGTTDSGGSTPGRSLGLQAWITLSVGIATVVILAAFGYIATWVVRESASTVIRNRLQVAEVVAGQVSELLTGYRHELEDLAWELSQEPDLRRQQAILEQSGVARRFAALAIVTPDGRVAWARPAQWLAYPALRLSSALAAVGQGGALALPPVAANPGAHPAALALALRGSGYFLVGAVDLAHLMNGFNDGGDAALNVEIMDPRGIVLASSEQKDVGQPSEHLPVIAALVRQGRAGIVLHNVPQHPHYVAYTLLPEYPGWAVNVEQPRDVILSLPRDLRSRMALLGAVIVAGMSLLAFLHVRSVVRPLTRLREAASHIAGGDLDHPVSEARRDEVGELARTFETMRVKLKASREEIAAWNRELEDRVATRTRELTAAEQQLHRRIRQLTALHDIAQALSLLPLRTVGETAEEIVRRIAAATGGRCRLDLDSRTDLATGTPLAASAPGGPNSACPEDAAGLVSVPLLLQDRRIGMLWLDPAAAGLTGEDPAVTRIVASQVAVAVENAELYDDVRGRDAIRRRLLERIVIAQEEERRRIARELHDEIGQALTALVMQLGTTEMALPPAAAPLRERLAEIRETTSQTAADVRRLMLNLRPVVLDDLGLVPAIRWLAESHLAPVGINVRVRVSGLDERERLPQRVELVAFRLTQEAVTNVLRHAHATRVTITLNRQNGVLALSIRDDGRGFDAGTHRTPGRKGGWGLVGMEERVSVLGGSLTVTSRLQHGTRVAASIPIGEGADRD